MTLLGITIAESDVHPSNADTPIEETLLLMVRVTILAQPLNVLSEITETDSGILIFESSTQPSNAELPIAEMLSGNSTVFINLHPKNARSIIAADPVTVTVARV